MSWERVLAPFKSSENKEVAALVLTDRNLQKLLAAWPLATVTFDGDPDDMAGCDWTAIWTACAVDRQRLETLTGMQTAAVVKSLERAKALQLVYPDGTIHQMAQMVIRKQIKDALA